MSSSATVDVEAALWEIKRARSRARGAADAIQGIPIYVSLWNALFDIERALDDAERKLGGGAS